MRRRRGTGARRPGCGVVEDLRPPRTGRRPSATIDGDPVSRKEEPPGKAKDALRVLSRQLLEVTSEARAHLGRGLLFVINGGAPEAHLHSVRGKMKRGPGTKLGNPNLKCTHPWPNMIW